MKKEIVKATCPICLQEFAKKQPNQLCCSRDHYRKYWYQKHMGYNEAYRNSHSAENRKGFPCQDNEWLDCNEPEIRCDRCGWNPEVAAARLRRIRKEIGREIAD